MSGPDILALAGSAVAIGLVTVALFRVGEVKGRLDRELDESRQQADRALGRDEGAAQERLIAAQARKDRAEAAALVLHPEPPTPTGPVSVVIVGQAEPVPVQVVVPVPVVTPEDEGG